MPIFSVEINVVATAYIRADSLQEAKSKAKALPQSSIEVGSTVGDVEVSGLDLDDPELPDVSLSPAMTIHSVDYRTLDKA